MIYRKEFLVFFSLSVIHSCLSVCIPSATQCGCSQTKPLLSQPKIVGGYTARNHSWPWIVSFRRLRSNVSATSPAFAFCGGTLISNTYILTAAHCFYGTRPSQLRNYFAVLGAQYINDTNPVRYKIKSLILHEEYDDQTSENDIALLELTTKVDFNQPSFGFICLPPSSIPTYPTEPLNGTAIGWGLLEDGGSPSYTLQQVQLPIMSYSNPYCSDVVYNDLLQFCAGFNEGQKDTCQGDSGGPLMIYDSNSDTWNIAGVTSYGYGCAVAKKPGVYTRVSMFVPWINAHTNGIGSSSRASTKKISNGIFIIFILFKFLF